MVALAIAAAVMYLTAVRHSDTDINGEIQRFHRTPGAFLVDVRTEGEYAEGHIPGSINVPLQRLNDIYLVVNDKSAPLFVYCRSGRRSGEAKTLLEASGFTEVYNIGGILDYKGLTEK